MEKSKDSDRFGMKMEARTKAMSCWVNETDSVVCGLTIVRFTKDCGEIICSTGKDCSSKVTNDT